MPTRYVALVALGRLPSKQYLRTGGVTSSSLEVLAGLALSTEEYVDLMTTVLPGFRVECYAQDERTVKLGAFECEGGSSVTYLATVV